MGSTGATGLTGATGADGYIGSDGATGSTGATGLTGATGADGYIGSDGATGSTGATGFDGATGATGATGSTGATGATGPAPSGNPGDLVYLISSGVAGATANVSYTGDGNFYAGGLATLSNLYVPGSASIEYLSVSNLAVTGNLIITATNVQTTNALVITNSGTATALKVTQNEPTLHTHNVAEFWDATTLAMVIDPEGNVGIHTTVSPGYSLTVTDPANFETLYIRGKTGVTNTLSVTGNVSATAYWGDGGNLSNLMSSMGATGAAGSNGATGATGAAGPAPSGSTGAMLYLSSSGVVASTTVPDLVWDNTNKRLGIGTNPTTYTFQVNGTVGVSGDITALYSDERLKTRTGALVNALDKVCMLDTFTYVSNELAQKYGFTDSTQRVGLSAQQVQKVLPEVVKPAPFDADNLSGQNFLTVQYDKLVPLLIESIKEIKVRLERLEKQT
jgi:hypothetical protein